MFVPSFPRRLRDKSGTYRMQACRMLKAAMSGTSEERSEGSVTVPRARRRDFDARAAFSRHRRKTRKRLTTAADVVLQAGRDSGTEVVGSGGKVEEVEIRLAEPWVWQGERCVFLSKQVENQDGCQKCEKLRTDEVLVHLERARGGTCQLKRKDGWSNKRDGEGKPSLCLRQS